jgi:uncharacterized protein YciI
MPDHVTPHFFRLLIPLNHVYFNSSLYHPILDLFLMRLTTFIVTLIIWVGSATIIKAQSPADTTKPETFNYTEGDTTYVMQKYFIAFLKSGPTRSQTEEEAQALQKKHLAHIQWMADQGYISMAGPFGDDGDIRGILVFNTATKEQARRLANQDPSVQAGRLIVEIHPWWAAKGSTLN